MHEVHLQPDGSAKLVMPDGVEDPAVAEDAAAKAERRLAGPLSMPESEVLQQEIAAAQAQVRQAVEAVDAEKDPAPTTRRRRR